MITQNYNTSDIPLNFYIYTFIIIALAFIILNIIIIIIMMTKKYYFKENGEKRIKNIIKLTVTVGILMLCSIVYQKATIEEIYNQKYGNETVNLLTIKDKIKVENNTVTIDKLPNHLKYKPFDTGTYDIIPQYIVVNNMTIVNNQAYKNYIYLDKDEKQTFYISENPNIPTLYNQQGYIYLMSPEEFEMIKTLKNK